MTYFDLFEIPIQLQVDKALITRKYFELSRKYHPDYHSNTSPETQAETLEMSALLNRAYRVLQNPDETLRYVLQIKGLLEEEEKYELPADFLMEVMEINESLMDSEDPETREKVIRAISILEESIRVPVQDILTGYRDGQTPVDSLLKVKDFFFKKKYIDRIRKQLAG